MFQFLSGRWGHWLILIAAAMALYFPGLGKPSLWDIDEGNNATCAREMLEADNWIVPTFNYQLRTDKPVMLYWLQMLAYRYWGVSEAAARLPSALACLLAVLLTYELGRRLFDRSTGLLAGLILASAPAVAAAAHFANPDALLNLFTLLTFFFFWRGYAGNSRSWIALTGVSTGLAVLTKGPVGLVLPLAVITMFLIWSGQIRRLLNWRTSLGALTFVFVAGPWYGWVGNDTRWEFFKGFFLKHNLDRFRAPMEGHAGPPFYYAGVLLAGLALWACFLGPTVWFAFRDARALSENDGTEKRRLHPQKLLAALGSAIGLAVGCWLGMSASAQLLAQVEMAQANGQIAGVLRTLFIPLLGFPLAGGVSGFLAGILLGLAISKSHGVWGDTRLFNYVGAKCDQCLTWAGSLRPAHRFLACWIGVYFVFFSLSRTKLPNYILPIYPVAALLIARFLDCWRRESVSVPAWAWKLSLGLFGLIGVGIGAGFIVGSGITGAQSVLHGRSLPGLASWALLGLIPLGGAAAAYWLLKRDHRLGVVTTVTASSVVFAGFMAVGPLQTVDIAKAPRPLAAALNNEPVNQDIRIASFGYFQPSLVFYCGREVKQLIQDQQVFSYLSSPLPVYLFLPEDVWQALEGQTPHPCRVVARHRDFYRGKDIVLITNHPERSPSVRPKTTMTE